jgi:hypothetical protein
MELYDLLPEDERSMVDALRHTISETLPGYCQERLSYNVPFLYGNKGTCIVWPAAAPREGIKAGVLLGFWNGQQLVYKDRFLTQGTNKQIFYRIYRYVEEIDKRQIRKLLKEAVRLDLCFRNRK